MNCPARVDWFMTPMHYFVLVKSNILALNVTRHSHKGVVWGNMNCPTRVDWFTWRHKRWVIMDDGMKTYSYSLVYKGSKYQKSSLFKWEKCDKTFSGKTPLKKTWIIPYWWKVVCLHKMWQGILTKKQFEDTRIVPPGMEFLQHFSSTKRVLAMFFIIPILWMNDWERATTLLM